MDAAKFRDVAAVGQNVLVAAAVVIGGLWTIVTYALERPDRKAELELFTQAVLNVTVTAKQLVMDDDGGLYIGVTADVVNAGKRLTRLDFTNAPPFKVSRISFAKGDVAERVDPILARNVTRNPVSAIASRGTDQFHMFIRVPQPGYYYVEFSGGLSDEELKNDPRLSADTSNWWGATAVLVEKQEAKSKTSP
jgi:hypothetical protein